MPRKEERVSYFNEVVLEWASGRREARITDLSHGGCYVETIATLPEGADISFDLASADGHTVRINGVVAHVFPGFGFGIKFVDLSDAAEVFIFRVVKNLV